MLSPNHFLMNLIRVFVTQGVTMVLRHRTSNFRWELITMYGPAQHDRSQDFISELSWKCIYSNLPMVIGGDFNMIR
jgi:hypothetical protein